MVCSIFKIEHTSSLTYNLVVMTLCSVFDVNIGYNLCECWIELCERVDAP